MFKLLICFYRYCKRRAYAAGLFPGIDLIFLNFRRRPISICYQKMAILSVIRAIQWQPRFALNLFGSTQKDAATTLQSS